MMQAEVKNISFDQLVQLVKQLPVEQLTELKKKIVPSTPEQVEREAFRDFLLTGPVFSKKQLKTIEKTRKEINQWRTK